MVSWELKGTFNALVDTLAVRKNVSVRAELAKHWSILHNLFLDVLNLSRNAEVDQLVEVLRLSALVLLEMVLWALALLSSGRVARLGDEATALTPRKHLVDSAACAL